MKAEQTISAEVREHPTDKNRDAKHMNTIRFKALSDAAYAFRATAGAAGIDLVADSIIAHERNLLVRYGTGVAVEIPDGYAGLIIPRSSIYKRGMVLHNSVGLIDSDYRGEIQFIFAPVREDYDPYDLGDRIGQLVVVQVGAGKPFDIEWVDELSDTERGEGGFGSTGN